MNTNNNLFFVCSLIEFIGRKQKLSRNDVVCSLGYDTVKHIYDFADVLHCEPISKVADEYIALCKPRTGNFDNVASCKYEIPSYWDIGKVYARLIQDVSGDIAERDNIMKTFKKFTVHGSATVFQISIQISSISRTIIYENVILRAKFYKYAFGV